jgi:hypothetical protein
MLSEATLPDTRPADATNGDLPELLDRMIAAKQLTATDARSFLASPRTGVATSRLFATQGLDALKT